MDEAYLLATFRLNNNNNNTFISIPP